MVIEEATARLMQVADHAHRTGVKVAVENGGSFERAADVAGLLDEVGSSLVGACYNVAVGHEAGEAATAAFNVLGDNLWAVRVQDFAHGKPCRLGAGGVPVRAAVERLAAIGYSGPVIYEHDRAWLAGLEPAEQVLPAGAAFLYGVLGAPGPGQGSAGRGAVMSH